jgi:hypothetical protein
MVNENGVGSNWHGDGQFTYADTAMKILFERVGHNEGFQPSDPMPVRREAIERWKQWWEKEGKAEYVRKYPEARDLWRE